MICALNSCRLRVIMNLHTITMMFFLSLTFTDSRKYSRNSILAALILDEVTPNDHDIDMPLDSSPTTYGKIFSSPSLPPYDSLAPIPLPQNTPPFCLYPPFTTPQTPPFNSPPSMGGSVGGGDGGGYVTPPVVPSPPFTTPQTPPFISTPPVGGSGGDDGGGYITPPVVPSPPFTPQTPPFISTTPPVGGSGGDDGGGYIIPPVVPSPPSPQLGPTPETPSYVYPNPPPPSSIINVPITAPPTPTTTFVPGSPVFLPPIVYPPPAVPPPPYVAPPMALWCVAKPSVPGPIIEEAMNYACGSGADCDQIQPNGSCFSPDSLVAHASYAFNSYWQRTKVAGGTCDFGGTAILVTIDPSYDGCQFMYF